MQLPTTGRRNRAPHFRAIRRSGLRAAPGCRGPSGSTARPSPGWPSSPASMPPTSPSATDSLARVYARHVLEHLEDVPAAMAEIHRVLRPGGELPVEVPYFASVTAYADPTHRAWFTYTTFEHFGPPVDLGLAGQPAHLVRQRPLRHPAPAPGLRRGPPSDWACRPWPTASRRFYENLLLYLFPARVPGSGAGSASADGARFTQERVRAARHVRRGVEVGQGQGGARLAQAHRSAWRRRTARKPSVASLQGQQLRPQRRGRRRPGAPAARRTRRR